ncbi:MAG: AbrB/MazE/SpoVT family DNA-binding domain-containing protein [Nitrospiraceae bacterium]
MAMTTISPKLQIVISKEVRENLYLAPSRRLQIMEKGGSHHPGAGSPPEIAQGHV